jgi:thiol:disulfide interchange protein DsbD
MRIIVKALCYLMLLFSVSASALDVFNVNNEPLPANQAYQFSATRNGDTITAHWSMAPGYYLYQDRFCFIVNGQRLNGVNLPPAESHTDDVLGEFKAYANQVDIAIPLPAKYAEKPVTLQVCYQGCSSNHFCYPPAAQEVTLAPNTDLALPGQSIPVPDKVAVNEQDKLTLLLNHHSLWVALISFFGIGLLLAFTPCVLPMVPILSSLIIGQQHISTARAFWISTTYVLGMAVTYAIIGIIAGVAGANLQAILQTPIAISIISLLFIALALSLFGFYDIHLPHWLETRVTHISNHQKSGSFIGAAIMGCLATLIVSPCVSPALIGAVTYIAQTGDSILGGLALFIMALGMGIPLILVGTFGGRILPHAGHWMDIIKQVFGVLMLMVAILLLSRILPDRITILMWAALLIISSIYLGLLQPALTGWAKFWKGVGLFFAICGGILLLSAAQGSSNLLQPLSLSSNAKANSSPFTLVVNSQALNNLLANASKQHKITMIDFYAKWCLSCKEMDLHTFSNPSVQTAMAPLQLVRVDITNATPDIKALMQKYDVIAPPTVIFLDENGQEIANSRVVGTVGPDKFLQQVNAVQSAIQ